MALNIFARFCITIFAIASTIASTMATPIAHGVAKSVDYDHLLKHCDQSSGCCKASVHYMRSVNAILKTERIRTGYVKMYRIVHMVRALYG